MAACDRPVSTSPRSLARLKPLLDLFIAKARQILGTDLVAVALFGSAARGDFKPGSDLDLFVVHDGDRRHIHRILLEVALDLRRCPEGASLREQDLPSEPYPILVSRERLASETPWILLDVADHGIILYDPVAVLEQKLASLRRRLQELGSRKVTLPDGTWYWLLKPDLKPGEVFEL